MGRKNSNLQISELAGTGGTVEKDWDRDPVTVARILRTRFGDDVRLYRGSDELHSQLDHGWPVRLPAPPFCDAEGA